MARYDRLAGLGAPGRDGALPCWGVLRDLEGNERDTDAARRARLRFLALRPVYRLAVNGFDAVPSDSFERQVERVREELGQLPARDPERGVLARFLNELRTRNPEGLVGATLQVSEFTEASGHLGAAEEYAECALGLAHSLQRDRLAAAALRVLAQVALAGEKFDEGETLAQRACDGALASDDRAEWIRAMGELAHAQRVRGNSSAARDTILHALRRARDWGEDPLIGLALARLCAHATVQSQYDQAVEHGWAALRLLNGGTERARVLLYLGDALVRLGLLRAAERCFTLVAQRASDPAVRAAGHAGLARAAAAGAQRSLFHDRRMAALRELPMAPRLTRANLHLDLAEAALLVADEDFSREHVREALALAGPDASAIARRADGVLSRIGRTAEIELGAGSTPEIPEQTRRIAAELELVADSVVAAE